MIHDLKCWPEYFQAVKSGIKPFELRKDDRGYAAGDILHLREFDPETEKYTGDEIDKTVTYVLPLAMFGAGNDERYVIMGLASRDWTPCAEGTPDTNDDVYITYEYRGKRFASVGFMGNSGDWYILSDDDGNEQRVNAIAWQPLPAPYNPDHIGGTNKKVED